MKIRSRGGNVVLAAPALAAVLLTANPAFAYEQEVKALAVTMAEKVHTAGKRTIAVVDFTDLQGNVTELGRFLAEELSIALDETGKGLDVVDRSNLASILKEQKLSASSLVDPQTTRQLGKITGVEGLVLGSLTPFGDSIRLSLKVIDTNTAKMITASSGNIAKIGAIEELLNRGIGAAPAAAPGPAGSARTATKKIVAAPARQSVEAQKFIFELQGCELSGQTIYCTLLILNRGNNRNLRVFGRGSRLFDDQGNAYGLGSATIANTTEKLDSYSYIEQTLLYDVAARATLTFYGISPQATSVSSLSLNCWSQEEQFPVDFRNISLEQKALPSLADNLSTGGQAQGLSPLAAGEDQTVTGAVTQEVKGTAKDLAKRAIRKFADRILKPLPIPPS